MMKLKPPGQAAMRPFDFATERLEHERLSSLASSSSSQQLDLMQAKLAALSHYQTMRLRMSADDATKASNSSSSKFDSSQFDSLDEEQIGELLDRMATQLNFTSFSEVYGSLEFGQVWWRVILVAVIVVLGVVGNSCVIYSITKLKRSRSKPTNTFILNMAIADLITCAFCPTVALIKVIYQFYVLGPFMCKFEGFLKITSLFVSSSALIVLSLDWLLSVVKPCRKRFSSRVAWTVLAIIWLLSILMGSILSYLRGLRERRWLDGTVEVWCSEPIRKTVIRVYWLCINLMLIYMPTICMTLALLIILAKMDTFEAKLRKSCQNQLGSLSINMRYRRLIVKILILYLLTSFICWTPMQVTLIYRHMRTSPEFKSWFVDLTFFSELSVAFSSAMNPIIFGFLSQPFRQLMTRLWLTKIVPCIRFNSSTNNNNPSNHDHNHNNNFSLRPIKHSNPRRIANLATPNPNRGHSPRNSARNQTNYRHRRQPVMTAVAAKKVSFLAGQPVSQGRVKPLRSQQSAGSSNSVNPGKLETKLDSKQQLRAKDGDRSLGLSRPTSTTSMVSVNIEDTIGPK